jgi:Na+-driven multidrug efflux pump
LAAHVRPATPLQVSRPKAVMAIQLTALLLKIPLSALFIYVWNLPLPLGMGP